MREHLKIYAKLKNRSIRSENILDKLDQAIESLADDVQLKSKLDVVSSLFFILFIENCQNVLFSKHNI